MIQPLAIDLFTGLHGWGEGFVAEGFEVYGFDLEDMGAQFNVPRPQGIRLIRQDIRTLTGYQLKAILHRLAVIVASPPCQKYSYMAMPWKRAKALAQWYRGSPGRIKELNELFDACFRIQREASAAAGRHIPLIVENVVGAQRWVGRAQWHFGSYYLWGDLPALMPIPRSRSLKVPGFRFDGSGRSFQSESVKLAGQNWSRYAETGEASPHWRLEAIKGPGGDWFKDGRQGQDACAEGLKVSGHLNIRNGHSHTRHLTNPAEHCEGVKGFTPNGEPLGKNTLGRAWGSKSKKRKAASAMIAKIPFPLARHIAASFKPLNGPH